MKKLIRNVLKKVLKNDLLWGLAKPVIKVGELLKQSRPNNIWLGKNEEVINLLGQPVVKNGPFKGLKYTDFKTFGSAVFPKLIGSYENEIAPIIVKIIENEYSEILDIGAAEGYYAVGLALKKPDTLIYAFDVDKDSRRYLSEMAKLNNVQNRIYIESFCSNETIRDFKFSKRGLIISDCEGYEKVLFDQSNLANLSNVDIIIEVHDCIDITISTYLKDLFQDTHRLEVYKSIDDIEKIRNYSFPETEALSLQLKKEIFSEKRPGIMEWYWLQPK